jgi:hypothetical protein
MDAEEARNILIHHNAWRRDDHVPNNHNMVDPTKLGIAIDVAIKILEEYINKTKGDCNGRH